MLCILASGLSLSMQQVTWYNWSFALSLYHWIKFANCIIIIMIQDLVKKDLQYKNSVFLHFRLGLDTRLLMSTETSTCT